MLTLEKPNFISDCIGKLIDQGMTKEETDAVTIAISMTRYLNTPKEELRTTFYNGSGECDHRFVKKHRERKNVCIACHQSTPIGYTPKLVWNTHTFSNGFTTQHYFVIDKDSVREVKYAGPYSGFCAKNVVIGGVYTNGYTVGHYALLGVAKALGYASLTNDAITVLEALFRYSGEYLAPVVQRRDLRLVEHIYQGLGKPDFPLLRHIDDVAGYAKLITHDDPKVREAIWNLESRMSEYIIGLGETITTGTTHKGDFTWAE